MKKAAQLAALILLLVACGGSQATTPVPSPQRPGPQADTWTSDGAAWHRAAGTGPTSRYLASLAYDAKRKAYVLFGGQTAKGSSDETWTWAGTAWKAASPAHKPRPRRAAAMAYDPAHQVVVLYGGLIEDRSEGGPGGDTWTWDGTDWTLVDNGPGAPGKRAGPQLATAGNKVILFGGHIANVDYYNDAWTWDGKAWSRLDKGPKPAGRGNSAVVWNPSDSSLFVYGGAGFKASAGIGAQGEPLGDAWSLTGDAWTQLKGVGPPALYYANAIWDARSKRAIVLLGMPCPKPSDSAWGWDGKGWSKLAAPGMSARWGAAVAQDPDGKALLFGGSDESGC
ncbi:MAG: hypothetical protein PVS2B1_04400 [Candidatus Dormibacteraceae bacterium]